MPSGTKNRFTDYQKIVICGFTLYKNTTPTIFNWINYKYDHSFSYMHIRNIISRVSNTYVVENWSSPENRFPTLSLKMQEKFDSGSRLNPVP